MNRQKRTAGLINGTASLISIALGLLFGFVLLLIFNPPFALYGFSNLMTTGFASSEKLAAMSLAAAISTPSLFTSFGSTKRMTSRVSSIDQISSASLAETR